MSDDREALERFEKQTEEYIEALRRRLAELEQRAGISSEDDQLETGEICVLEFEDSKEAVLFSQREKFWLFGKTWNAKVKGNLIQVMSYPALSPQQFQQFMNSKAIVPDKLCRFDQYYAKQSDALQPAKLVVKKKGTTTSEQSSASKKSIASDSSKTEQKKKQNVAPLSEKASEKSSSQGSKLQNDSNLNQIPASTCLLTLVLFFLIHF